MSGALTPAESVRSGAAAAVRGAASVVVGAADDRLLREYARDADRAVRQVSAVWGTEWAQRVAVVVAGNAADFARRTGRPSAAAVDGVAAAVTTRPEAGEGIRVIVEPSAFGRLTPLGRQVVLTHEVTHVATRAVGAAAMPPWLVEGFADYVAYRDTGLPPEVVARETLRDVRLSGPPAALPSATDFAATGPVLARAYERAESVCRLIARTYGEERLLALYRQVQADAASAGSQTALGAALAGVLATTEAELTVQWQRYLVHLAAAA